MERVFLIGVTGDTKRFAKNAKIIHIDVDAAEINKNVIVDLGIVGDAKCILADLNAKLSRQNHPQWLKEIRDLKERYPLEYEDEGLTGPYIMEQIDYLTNGEAIIPYRCRTTSNVGCSIFPL